MRKDKPQNWGSKQEVSFNKIKKTISNATVLQYPDFDKIFILTTGASGEVIGVILDQDGPAGELLVAFVSRQFKRQ